MSLELMSLILVGGLLFLLAIGLEIFAAMGIMASLGLLLFVGQPLGQFAFTSWSYMNSFTLTCMPLFIFMGAIFQYTGVITPLFVGANKWLGGLPGGLACSVLGANAIFGAMSGSSVAAAATFGKIAFPEMERLGYDPGLALGTIVVGGTLSVLIPPSIILVVYGVWQEVSIAQLFAAGMIPGIILALLLMLTIIVLVKLNPRLAPEPPKSTWREKLRAVIEIGPFVAIIVIVLGVIFAGIMTPTEAAAMGAFASIVLALAYRRMTFIALKESMLTAIKVTAMVAVIVVSAKVLCQVFQYIGLTAAIAEFMFQLPFRKYGIMAVLCVMYLILGCFFDSFSMMLLTLPFVTPIIIGLGFDLIWFGVVYVVLAEIGLVTPPFGLNLFVIRSVVPQHDIMVVARGALPFLVPTLLMIALLITFPQLALWLPRLLYR